ncbi:hypothetical protein, partial [Streptomyces sp. NRRL S-15]|uniref:hypothetical protein n=1 Tax=Streptomyces sp. NRRL S-15 TaxID=1463886 RepID=UPI001F3FCB86
MILEKDGHLNLVESPCVVWSMGLKDLLRMGKNRKTRDQHSEQEQAQPQEPVRFAVAMSGVNLQPGSSNGTDFSARRAQGPVRSALAMSEVDLQPGSPQETVRFAWRCPGWICCPRP